MNFTLCSDASGMKIIVVVPGRTLNIFYICYFIKINMVVFSTKREKYIYYRERLYIHIAVFNIKNVSGNF